ncbi:nuclear transport factor 2 family protein [Pseudonocardia nantongensis]|uniref:nuclear transport factor 2 family protein n=1 Tax=Pseudonocardia nantongensis TaxID=1181885 RepID=UPI00397D7F76
MTDPDMTDPDTTDAGIAHEVDQLLTRYVHAVDNAAWDELAAVFTPDAQLTGLRATADGLTAIVDYIAGTPERPAHHCVNTALTAGPRGSVHAWSRLITVAADGAAACGDYTDLIVPTTDGLRIHRRRVRLRAPGETAPGTSEGADPAALFQRWERERG